MLLRGTGRAQIIRRAIQRAWRRQGAAGGASPPTSVLTVCENKSETAWSDFTPPQNTLHASGTGSDEVFLGGATGDQQRQGSRGDGAGCTLGSAKKQ